MIPCPDRAVLMQGLLDRELDAANTAPIERHLGGCAACRAEYERHLALRAQLTRPGVSYRAPERLRASIEHMIVSETAASGAASRRRSAPPLGWAAGGAFGGLLAATLALTAAVPQFETTNLDRQLVAGHVRSLLANHLVDVQTSDQHVVRPWFNGKVDVAPPAPELAGQGFPLVGGRLDYVDGRVTPAIVYRRRAHTVNLFVSPARLGQAAHRVARRDGYSLVQWTAGGLRFSAVSDIDASELETFRRAFARAAQPS